MDGTKFALMVAALLPSLAFHEAAHAWTAWKLGDPTGKALGRVSLNPIRHIDPFGTLLLPVLLWWASNETFTFAYAKPVPYNPYNLKNPHLGSVAIAGAGPSSNFLLGLGAAVALGFALPQFRDELTLGHQFLFLLLAMNINLGVFNLLPIPPLDGGTVLAGLLGRRGQAVFSKIEPFGFLILVALMYTGLLSRVMDPALRFLTDRALALAEGIRG